jgi:hypothetical protein
MMVEWGDGFGNFTLLEQHGSYKMVLVLPAYGTTYYIPEVSRDGWQAHGVVRHMAHPL